MDGAPHVLHGIRAVRYSSTRKCDNEARYNSFAVRCSPVLFRTAATLHDRRKVGSVCAKKD